MNGIITKGIGGFYYILAEDENIYECKARGIFRKEKVIPTVGDRVEISIENGKGNIEEIKERKTMLIRPNVANVDSLVIVIAAMTPTPSLFLIDKLLVNAKKNNIEASICINKTDLTNRDDISDIYEKAGYKVMSVSAAESKNIDELGESIKGKVCAFAGLSGVGKSSLLNLLTDNTMETGVLSDKIGRGKHTTRHVELMRTKTGGFVFDTPGFSSFEIDDIDKDELKYYFNEFIQYEGTCRFRGCAHINEPKCIVREMVNSGEISKERYESYKLMYETLKNKKMY